MQCVRGRICISTEGISVEETTPSVLAPFGSSAVDLEGIHPETFFFFSSPLFSIFCYFFGLLLGHQNRNFHIRCALFFTYSELQ